MLDKTEEAIKNWQSRDTGNTGYTIHRTKINKTKRTTHKTKLMSNIKPTKYRDWTQIVAKGKQFLPIIRHPQCYSYSQDVLYTKCYTSTFTNNINMTRVLLQTTGGKDEPNIVLLTEIKEDITTRRSKRNDIW